MQQRHKAIIIVLAVIIGLGGLLAWQIGSDNPGKPGQKTQKQTCNAQKEICDFIAWYHAQKQFTITAVNKSGEQKADTLIQVDGENASMKLTGMINYEVIRLGTTTYTKTPDGTWWKYTEPNNTLTQFLQNGKPQLVVPTSENKNTVTYTKEGPEACGQQTCIVYQFNNKDADTHNTLWVDQDTKQLKRSLTTSGVSTYDATYDFSRPVISLPSPVKDLKKGQFVGPNQHEPLGLPPTGG